MIQDSWAGLLEPDENVIWQGQPDAGLDWRDVKPVKFLVGTLFGIIGLGVAGATLAGQTASFPEAVIPFAIGLAFAAVGLRASVGDVILDAYARSNTWYTLTSRRVIVATGVLGKRRLRDAELTPETGLILEDGTPGTIEIPDHSALSFRRIPEARRVYGLMRQVQRSAA